MSNGNDDGHFASPWTRDIVQITTALTALIIACGGFYQGCHNRVVSEQHAEKISQNAERIDGAEQKATIAADDAETAKAKAVVIEKKVTKMEAAKDK